MRDTKDEENEVVLEQEEDVETDDITPEEDETNASALAQKLKKLRTELLAVQKERDENLAGWQRAKADAINSRKLFEQDRARDLVRAKGSIVLALIPALDSFESAMVESSWSQAEEKWRKGVERIADQLRSSLTREGVSTFGEVGEPFSPLLHECVSIAPTEDETKDHTLAQVFQKGYRFGEEVLRPAKVVVAQKA